MIEQVGGTHYESSFQHWDLIEDHGIGYCEATATKYLVRWKKKNGLEDLKKARSYIEKLLNKHKTRGRRPRGSVPEKVLTEFYKVNGVEEKEAVITSILLSRWDEQGLITAIEKMQGMIMSHGWTII